MNFVRRSFLNRGSFLVADRHPIPIYFEQLEPPLEHVWSKIQPGDVVVDVGACYGTYTLPALLMGASVVAYEPFDDGRMVLREEVAANDWEARCRISPLALGNGAAYPPELANEVWTKHYPTSMPTFTTLDEEHNCVDWIKCDNEGGELLFLQGAAKMLEKWHPTLVVEDHQDVDLAKESAVSTWPASIDSSARIHAMLTSMDYQIEVMTYDISRKFIIAKHPTRWP